MVLSITVGIYSLQDKHKIQNNGFSMVKVSGMEDIVKLVPTSPQEIKKQETAIIAQIEKIIDEIIEIPHNQRTFANTVLPLAQFTLTPANVVGNMIGLLEVVSPDEAIRTAAHEATIKLKEAQIELFNSKQLYNAVKSYVEGNRANEQLTAEQDYCIQDFMDSWRRAGLELPDEQFSQVQSIKKELAQLTTEFDQHIALDTSHIIVNKEDLAGLRDSFVDALKKTDEGRYILGVDYPTYHAVMEQCSVADTRKKLFRTYTNRAYPHNEELLKKIIAKRAELAHKLGFSSYAELDLADQMVGSPARADQFMVELKDKAQIKARQELEQFTADLPDSVTVTADGRLQPWDSSFVVNAYKKKHYDIDEELIAEYFPMEKTIQGLFAIYEKFFSIKFKQVSVDGIWHEEVKAVEVSDNNGLVLGYLLLDLYPRPFKYSHAAHMMVMPPSFIEGKPSSGVGVVLANFTKSTADKPSLLKQREVSTFFHEFGHALHALLGRTQLASQAGTHVKTDFVELPSQMLEEWLLEKEILAMVSSHYKTGESLPNELIDKIIEAKNIAMGNWILGQLFYSQLSLCFFNEGPIVDVQKRMQELRDQIIVTTVYDSEDRFYSNFGHLTEYGAKYYGYLWSKVFAKDLFAYIKEHGLLNPEVGQKYIAAVLSKGGSKDPNELLKDFLGRAPSQEAFLKDIGLV